ncbi:MAG: hypothetical protein WC382_10740 [Methanoregulaceae archaeon]
MNNPDSETSGAFTPAADPAVLVLIIRLRLEKRASIPLLSEGCRKGCIIRLCILICHTAPGIRERTGEHFSRSHEQERTLPVQEEPCVQE